MIKLTNNNGLAKTIHSKFGEDIDIYYNSNLCEVIVYCLDYTKEQIEKLKSEIIRYANFHAMDRAYEKIKIYS